MSAHMPSYATAMIRCSKRKCAFKGHESNLLNIKIDEFLSKKVCPLCGCDSYFFMTEKEILKFKKDQQQFSDSVKLSGTRSMLALCDLAKPELIEGQRLFASKSIVVAVNDSQPLADRLADIHITIGQLNALRKSLTLEKL